MARSASFLSTQLLIICCVSYASGKSIDYLRVVNREIVNEDGLNLEQNTELDREKRQSDAIYFPEESHKTKRPYHEGSDPRLEAESGRVWGTVDGSPLKKVNSTAASASNAIDNDDDNDETYVVRPISFVPMKPSRPQSVTPPSIEHRFGGDDNTIDETKETKTDKSDGVTTYCLLSPVLLLAILQIHFVV